MARKKKNENQFKNEFSYQEILEKEQTNDKIVIDGVSYSIEELKALIQATIAKKNPLDVLKQELPIIKERFANMLNSSKIIIASAVQSKGIIYGLITDGERVIVIKRFENGYIGLVKGVYSLEIMKQLFATLRMENKTK